MQALRRNDSEGEAIRELLAWMFQASRKGWVLVKDHRIVATNPTFDELDLQSRIGQSWAPAPAGEVDPSEPSCHGPFESLRALVIRHSGVVPSPHPRPPRFVRGGQVIELMIHHEPAEGAHVAALVIVRDITQIARLEEDLRRARERFIEQEALRTMGEIAAGVGHDLVNILTAFKLCTGQLAKHAQARGVELRHVDVVLRAAQQAANLASKLVGMGRRAPGPPGLVDLRQVIHDAIDLGQTALRARAGASVVPFRIVVELPELPKIEGDRAELQRVFLNLFLNARDAMPDGGTVEVRARVYRGFIVVSVKDDGPGLPQEHLSRVFDPFFTTKGDRGSGIGLSVAKRVMDSLGGSISVRNGRRGARFDLRFPTAL